MVYLGREDPHLPCDVILEDGDWKASCVFTHGTPPPDKPSPLSEGVWMIGKIGAILPAGQRPTRPDDALARAVPGI